MKNVKSKLEIRDSGVEILRIFSMILIVAHHYAVHGFSPEILKISFFNTNIVDILSLGGKVGVNCFILITGYYMLNSEFTIKKFLKLEGQILFYSIAILLLFMTILEPVSPIGIRDMIKNIFPSIYSSYWFITLYIVLMFFLSFINKFIKGLEKKEFKKLLLIISIFWIFIPTFMKGTVGYSELVWFISLYFIAAYIKLYINLDSINLKKCLFIFLISSLIMIGLVILINYLIFNHNISFNSRYFAKENNLLAVIVSISAFLIAIKIKLKNKFVNIIASATFGVYLIHDNGLLRPYLWKNIFECEKSYLVNNVLLHSFLTIIIVYIVCTIVDLIRQETIEKVYMNYIVPKICNIFNKFSSFINKICK